MTIRHPGDLVLWLAVLVPWSTKLLLATTNPGMAYVQTPMILWLTALLATVAWWIGTKDYWLGMLLAWEVIHLLWQPTPSVFESVETMVLGAFLLQMVRQVPVTHQTMFRYALIGTAILQTMWLSAQWLGMPTDTTLPAGTFGNKNYLGAYLAMVMPVTPWFLIPVVGYGLFLSKSMLAWTAACAGLWWRWRDWWALHAVCFLAGLLFLASQHPGPGASWSARWDAWTTALDHLTFLGWVTGVGPGQWLHVYGSLPVSYPTSVEGYFAFAHSDLLQLVFESGLPALVCLGGWLWSQRALWRSPWAGSVVALGILSLAFFPWHLVTTGVVAVAIVACATSTQKEAV